MCGICGYISRKRITEEQLRAMNDTMYHRGPDDGGAEIYEMRGGWQVGFAQRRLWGTSRCIQRTEGFLSYIMERFTIFRN